jgi:hypothetical protein
MTYSNIQIIKKLNEGVLTGYHKDELLVAKVISGLMLGKIRIAKEEDVFWSIDDLAGDMFNPDVNDDISPAILKKQRRSFVARVNRSGVWGAVAETWNGRAWDDESTGHNAIFGFVGNDFVGSGYELQLLEEALERYEAQPLDIDGFVVDPYRLTA